MRVKKKGQSTLEYLLVLGAVVVLIIAAAGTWIKGGVQTSTNNAGESISRAADQVNKF